jgi:hypothetical protein
VDKEQLAAIVVRLEHRVARAEAGEALSRGCRAETSRGERGSGLRLTSSGSRDDTNLRFRNTRFYAARAGADATRGSRRNATYERERERESAG